MSSCLWCFTGASGVASNGACAPTVVALVSTSASATRTRRCERRIGTSLERSASSDLCLQLSYVARGLVRPVAAGAERVVPLARRQASQKIARPADVGGGDLREQLGVRPPVVEAHVVA